MDNGYDFVVTMWFKDARASEWQAHNLWEATDPIKSLYLNKAHLLEIAVANTALTFFFLLLTDNDSSMTDPAAVSNGIV